MEIEFHYWMTGFIAREAGFEPDEAAIIAFSSQYVDENDVIFEVADKASGDIYQNYISQTMNILKPKKDLMRIYPMFHFVPGEPDAPSARRKDGKRHILNTTPNSENANEIVDSAFKSDHQIRLYRIGISTHSYVDTWAHQNFVGWYDDFNHIDLDIKPNIGHADGEHHPDWISHRWIDNRLVEPVVNNKLRFLSAARELFRKYCNYQECQGKPNYFSNWDDLKGRIEDLWGPNYTGSFSKYVEGRNAAYRKAMPWLKGFNERKWFDEAIETKIIGGADSHEGLKAKFTLFEDKYFWKEGLDRETTHWFRFQEAVKDHQKTAMKQIAPVFSEMGLELNKV